MAEKKLGIRNQNFHGENVSYFFMVKSDKVLTPRRKHIKNIPHPYLFHSSRPVYYKKGVGLFECPPKLADDILLLNEYQFRIFLRHAPMRKKLLREGKRCLKSELVEYYSSLKVEDIKHLDEINFKRLDVEYKELFA